MSDDTGTANILATRLTLLSSRLAWPMLILIKSSRRRKRRTHRLRRCHSCTDASQDGDIEVNDNGGTDSDNSANKGAKDLTKENSISNQKHHTRRHIPDGGEKSNDNREGSSRADADAGIEGNEDVLCHGTLN